MFFTLLLLVGCALQADIDATNEIAYIAYMQEADESDRRILVRPVTLIRNRNNPTIYEGLLQPAFVNEFYLFVDDIGVRADGAYHYVSLVGIPIITRDGVRNFNHENRLQLNLNDPRVIGDGISECNFPELVRNRIESTLSQRDINPRDVQRIFFEPSEFRETSITPIGWSGNDEFVVKLDNSYQVRIRLNNGENFYLSSFFTINDIYLTYDISSRFSLACSTTEPPTESNQVPLTSTTVLEEPGEEDKILIGRRFLYRARIDRSIDNLQPLTSPGFATQFFGPFRRFDPES